MKAAIRMTFLLLLALASLVSGYGQSLQNSQEEPVIVSTNLVLANVIVTDSKGRYVKGLTRNQFEIYDEKTRQEIAHFTADASPVSLGIVLEVHENATEKTKAILAAVKEFASSLGDRDDFFLVAFGEHGSVTTEFIPSADQLLNHLKFVKPGGRPHFTMLFIWLRNDCKRRAT
jgi:VWFA-related protein